MILRKLLFFLFTAMVVLITVSFVPDQTFYSYSNDLWNYLNYRFLFSMLLYLSSVFLCMSNFLYVLGMLWELPWSWSRKVQSREFFICIGYIALLLMLASASPWVTLLFCVLIGLQEGRNWVKKQKTTTWL